MVQITLVLHANNREKKVEISEKPKKLSHLKVVAQQKLDLISNTAEYQMWFKDQQQKLTDDLYRENLYQKF